MSVLGWMKNNWNKPIQAAGAIITAVGVVLRPPDAGICVGDATYVKSFVNIFLIPVTWLLIAVCAHQLSRRQDAIYWTRLSVVLCVIAVAGWMVYSGLLESWSFPSSDGKATIVKGSHYTAETISSKIIGMAKMRDHMHISENEAIALLDHENPNDLLSEAGQDPDKVWTRKSIDGRKFMLTFLYVMIALTIVATMMSASQSWFCSRRST